MTDTTATTNPETTEVPEDTTGVTPDTNEVPEWVREKLTKANNEAAKYRVRAQEASETARQEVESEFASRISTLENEKESVSTELKNARGDLAKLHAAIEAGIPGDSVIEFAGLLKGETDEEIKQSAESVKKLLDSSQPKKAAYDPHQGVGGGTSDPESAFGSFLMNMIKK